MKEKLKDWKIIKSIGKDKFVCINKCIIGLKLLLRLKYILGNIRNWCFLKLIEENRLELFLWYLKKKEIKVIWICFKYI